MMRSPGCGVDMQLAEGGDVVEAGIGARVGDHHQAVAHEDSAAIGHGEFGSSCLLGGEVIAAPLASKVRSRLGHVPNRSTRVCVCWRAWATCTATVSVSPPPPIAGAAHRRGAEIIESDGDPHMRIGGADAVGRVEADPAEVARHRLPPRRGRLPARSRRRCGRNGRRRSAPECRSWRAAAMKIWVRSWQTPRRSAKASAAVVAVCVGSVSKVISRLSARHQRVQQRRADRMPRPARTASAKSTIAASAAVSAVSRRNSCRRKALDRAGDHAVGILRVDLAFDRDRQVGRTGRRR